MIKVRYEHMKFHFIQSHYDYHQYGTCIWNGKVALFRSTDETDYDTMNKTCPYCNDETTDINQCHCENAPDVYCYITELPFYKRVYYRMYPYLQALWYIKNYGLQ